MKYSRKDLTPSKVELTVTLDAADLAVVRPAAVALLARNLKLPGFRPGKVPAAVAEKHIDPQMLETQVAENGINRFVVEALETEDLRALDRPEVDVTKLDPTKELVFVATVEILPTVTLGDYRKLKAKKAAVEVKDEDIQEVIERMRLGFSEKTEVDRAAKDGDEAWIDFDGVDKDGESIAGASGKDYPLRIGSGTFIPGFEEGIVGKKPGDEFELPLTFPKDYHHEPLAGVKVIFKTTIKKVNEIVLPKVDDEFAKKCGPFSSLAELQEDIERELTAQRDREATDALKDSLIEQLVAASNVPVPDILIKDQVDAIERDTMQNLMYRGQTIEQHLESIGKTRDEWRDSDLKDAAVRRVQVGLVLAELSKAEKIDISKEELEARLREMIETNPNPTMSAQLQTPEARRDLANRALTEKTVDRLIELNTKK